MAVDIKAAVLDSRRNTSPPNITLMFGEDDNLLNRDNLIILLLVDEILPSRLQRRKIRKHVAEVIEIGVLVERSSGALDEAVHQLVHRNFRGAHALRDSALKGDEFCNRVGLGEVGEEHGDFVGVGVVDIGDLREEEFKERGIVGEFCADGGGVGEVDEDGERIFGAVLGEVLGSESVESSSRQGVRECR